MPYLKEEIKDQIPQTNQVEDEIEILVKEEDHQRFNRLDLFLKEKLVGLSRTFIKSIYDEELISTLDNKKLVLSKMPQVGTQILVQIPPPLETNIIPQNIPLEILYEDEYLIIVNKPAGMVTHPAPGNYQNTLVNAILFHDPSIGKVGGVKRPGIVHRLDKGTSGSIVVAKTLKAYEGLVLLFSKHQIDRLYEAITLGIPGTDQGTISGTIGRHPQDRKKMAFNVKPGKNSITHYKIIKKFKHFAFLECQLETGRTHQIRVHLSTFLKTPIINDETYGNIKKQEATLPLYLNNQLKENRHPFLHARLLGFIHPITGEKITCEAQRPLDFQHFLDELDKIN